MSNSSLWPRARIWLYLCNINNNSKKNPSNIYKKVFLYLLTLVVIDFVSCLIRLRKVWKYSTWCMTNIILLLLLSCFLYTGIYYLLVYMCSPRKNLVIFCPWLSRSELEFKLSIFLHHWTNLLGSLPVTWPSKLHNWNIISQTDHNLREEVWAEK